MQVNSVYTVNTKIAILIQFYFASKTENENNLF